MEVKHLSIYHFPCIFLEAIDNVLVDIVLYCNKVPSKLDKRSLHFFISSPFHSSE